MKRKPVIIAILTLMGLSGYFIWAYSSVREGFDPENDFANWQPNAEAIHNQLPKGTPAERQAAFAKLFQERFRKHEPGKAVGVHFTADGKIHLLTPARLEPWNVDRIALMLYHEAQQDLNKNFDIDIYETFIGTPPIRIAQMRPAPNTPKNVVVRYHYPVGEATMAEIPGKASRLRPTGMSGTSNPPAQKPSL